MTTTKTIPTKTFKIRVSQTLVRSENCYKGPFDTVEELLTVEAYNGDYADVFETDTRWKYNGQTWENTNQPIPTDCRYALEEDVSVTASPNTIAKRDSDGALSVGTPTAAQHATSKEYVDNTDAALSQRIEEHYDETSQNFTELGQALQDETTRATQAEAELSNSIVDLKQQIQDETNRAEAAEGILADEIDATKTLVQNEQDRATQAEADLNTKIESEANTRDEADNALGQRINALSTTVQQNDNKQTSNLQAETQRAQTAEQTLQTNIDTKLTRVENVTADDQAYVKNADGSQSMLNIDLNATPSVLVKRDAQGHVKTAAPTSDDDASTKHYVDAAVQAIDEEALALQQALNNEISRAQAAEEILATSIDEEIVRAKAAEQTNATAISEETTRAKAAEKANANAIAAETTRAEQAETTLQDALNSETQARQSADATLQQNIDTLETTLLGTATENGNTLGKLEDMIEAETTRAEAAEGDLQQDIESEASTREQADNALTQSIQTEQSARTQADTTLQTNIDNEVKARQDADTALEQSIEQTKTEVVGDASTNANTLGKLEDLLTAEQTARQSADSSLQSSVSALQSSKLDKSFSTAVLTGCTYVYTSSDDSSKLQFNVINPSTNAATTLAVSIPKATSSQPGLMPKESVTQLSNLGTRVSALEGKQYRYLYTASANPTASDINTFVAGQGGTAPFSGVEVIVEDTMHIWRYYQNDNIGWRDDGIDTVSTATQTTLGVVQGSNEDGKVYVESDGTMSFNGYDALVDANEANAQAISSEATVRAQAVSNLQSNLNAETSAREQADATLQANITAEANTRQQEDTALNDAIEAETSARQAADTTLQDNIDAEATARQNADNALTTQLGNKLDKVTSTASLQRAYVITAAGAQSTVNIDNNPTANTLALRDSSGRMKTATPSASTDAANKQYVDDISNALDGEINDANTALQAEVEARQQADTALGQRIDDVINGTTPIKGDISPSNIEIQDGNINLYKSTMNSLGGDLNLKGDVVGGIYFDMPKNTDYARYMCMVNNDTELAAASVGFFGPTNAIPNQLYLTLSTGEAGQKHYEYGHSSISAGLFINREGYVTSQGELRENNQRVATRNWVNSGYVPKTYLGDEPSVDLNELTAAGMYRLNNNIANAPSGVTFGYGQLLVISGGGDTVVQIITPYQNPVNTYIRSGNPLSSNGVWTTWRKIFFQNELSASTVNNANNLGGVAANEYALKTDITSVPDATTTVKGVALLGASGGAARYGQKADVGLSNVDNTSDANKPVSTAQQAAIDTVQSDVDDVVADLTSHTGNKSNPHAVTKAQVGLGNVDNVKQYSASNPPPYPVTSVNNKTGAVTLTKSDVGLSNVANVLQYSASNPPPYPVTSVAGKTGAVTLSKSDVGLSNVPNVNCQNASNIDSGSLAIARIASGLVASGAGITVSRNSTSGVYTVAHSNSITASNGGPTANQTLSYGGTFIVPYFTYDARGHITGRTNRTMTMPASPSPKVYTRTVSTSNWSGSAGNYTYTINASTHGCGTTPSVHTYVNNEETYDSPTIDSSGNITLRSNARVAMKVVIKQ